MEEEEKQKRWTTAFRGLLEQQMSLVKLIQEIMPAHSNLSADDWQRFIDALGVLGRVSQAASRTLETTPTDADMFDQMLASTERLREEAKAAIKTFEEIAMHL